MQSDRGGPRSELNATIYSLQSLHVWVTSKPGGVGEKKKGVTPSLGPTEEREKTVSPITETMRQENLAHGAHSVLFSFVCVEGNVGSQPHSRCSRGPASPGQSPWRRGRQRSRLLQL